MVPTSIIITIIIILILIIFIINIIIIFTFILHTLSGYMAALFNSVGMEVMEIHSRKSQVGRIILSRNTVVVLSIDEGMARYD